MPFSGSPSRLCMTVQASTSTGPSYSPVTSRGEVVASASGCASAHRKPFGRRLGRVDPDGVLGDETAVRRAHSVVAWVGSQAPCHRRDRVGDVVVPRSARERQSAGHGERTRRIVRREPEFLGGDLDRGREARVQVDMSDVVDADAGERRALGAPRRGWRATSADRPGWRRLTCRARRCRCAGTPIDHAARRAASAASTEHMSNAAPCSTVVVRVHELRIREADPPVVGTGRADLLGRVTRAGSRRSGSMLRPR